MWTFQNPKINLNRRNVRFPVSLAPRFEKINAEPWEYVEFNRRRIRKYDGNHQLLSSNWLPFLRITPIVRKGANTLRYTHTGGNRALVRLLLEGDIRYPSP